MHTSPTEQLNAVRTCIGNYHAAMAAEAEKTKKATEDLPPGVRGRLALAAVKEIEVALGSSIEAPFVTNNEFATLTSVSGALKHYYDQLHHNVPDRIAAAASLNMMMLALEMTPEYDRIKADGKMLDSWSGEDDRRAARQAGHNVPSR